MRRQDLIARIIELLVTSSITPTYQETVLSALQDLDDPALKLLCNELERLHSAEDKYQEAIATWLQGWSSVSKRLKSALQAEAECIREEVQMEGLRRRESQL